MSFSSPEFLINMKSVPEDPKSKEYNAFWANEDRKITEGVTVDGVHFSGFMYWHINLWSIYKDEKINGRAIRKLGRPDLWDTYLELDDVIQQAENHPDGKKGVVCVGSRRISKSVLSSSYIAHKAITEQGSHNLISALNTPDLKVITEYIDLGLRNLPEYFRFLRIEDDWKKQVTLGMKDKQTGIRHEWSKFHIRNFDEGNNTEVAAGLTLSSFLLEEAGKGKILGCLAATTPCFDSPFGWRCSPFVIGTSGDMSRATDLQELVYNPEAYNFLAVVDKETGAKHGLFIPGTKSLKIPKIQKSMAEFMGVKKKSELQNMIIHVSDLENGKDMILKSRDQIKKASGTEAYLKDTMYYPLTIEECFLDVSENIFPVDLLQEQLTLLESHAIKSDPVELYQDLDGSVKHRFTDKKPINKYPVKQSDDNEGVVQIWEFPVLDAPYGLYTAGTDPYKQSEAQYSTSIGSTYIFKRIHNLTGEGWQNMVVASYNARPKKIQTWYENTKMLLRFYNAKTNCENSDYGFIQHCIEKNEADIYFEKTPQYVTAVHPNSTVRRTYGTHPTAEIKNHYNGLIITYLNEVVDVEHDEKGNIIKRRMGVSRILDPMLIKELLKFHPKANCDRKDAFGLALAMAQDMNKNLIVSSTEDTRYRDYRKLAEGLGKKSPFTKSRTPFRSF